MKRERAHQKERPKSLFGVFLGNEIGQGVQLWPGRGMSRQLTIVQSQSGFGITSQSEQRAFDPYLLECQ